MDTLTAGDALVTVLLGPWSWLVPLRHIERVQPAAMPITFPAESGRAQAALQLGPALVPVVFGRALLGAEEVALNADGKMIVLQHAHHRAVLWVDGVEEVVAFEPWQGANEVPAEARQWLVGFCAGFPALPVLDVPRLIEATSGQT